MSHLTNKCKLIYIPVLYNHTEIIDEGCEWGTEESAIEEAFELVSSEIRKRDYDMHIEARIETRIVPVYE